MAARGECAFARRRSACLPPGLLTLATPAVGAGHCSNSCSAASTSAHQPQAAGLRRADTTSSGARPAARTRRERPGERLLRAHQRRLLLPGAGACRHERRRRPATPSARPATRGFIPAAASITRSPATAAATPTSTPPSSIARNWSPAAPATAATGSAWRISTSTPTRRCGPATSWRPGAAWWRSPAMKNKVADFTPLGERPRRSRQHA